MSLFYMLLGLTMKITLFSATCSIIGNYCFRLKISMMQYITLFALSYLVFTLSLIFVYQISNVLSALLDWSKYIPKYNFFMFYLNRLLYVYFLAIRGYSF